MKKALAVLLVLCLAFACFAGGSKEDGKIRVGISKVVAVDPLDNAEQGIKDYLAEKGIEAVFDCQNANGEASTAASIAQTFKSTKCDYVVGLGTPVAQALANVFDDIPVLFAAVTNPEDAGLVAKNICGTSDLTPVETNVTMWAKATGAKRIGNIYTSSEANSVFLNKVFEQTCRKLGVEPVSIAVANSAEVKQALQAASSRIDALYVDTDNTVASAITSVADVCTQYSIPLMTADSSYCDGLDFTISMGFNYYNLGQACGKIIEGLVNGKKPSDFGTVYLNDPSDFEVWVNLDNAKKNNVNIPQNIIDSASVVIENGAKR